MVEVVWRGGVRDNLLVGQGLVVGLAGTGDNLNNSVFTEKGLTDFLERLGVNVKGSRMQTKNIAAVTVTASLPAFARRGNKINIKVSAIGDAKSLKSGTLLATPLLGADGNVYAVAQGNVAISDFNPVSADVKNRNKAVETNGYIHDGAIVEDEIGFSFTEMDKVKLSLNNPDFSTARKITNAINDNIIGNIAKALDSGSIEITIPKHRKDNVVALISEVESITIDPDYTAKIVINEATGTIVIGDNVRIRPVAIAQGNLIVNVSQFDQENNYPPDTDEEVMDLVDGFFDKKRGRSVKEIGRNATLSDLVEGLNKLGVYPRDIINILYNMQSVGAIDAVIEVK
ncbi:MAG TPA: flagellar basal body P-ring protein FlgI, partial [Candidatus Megaira endosymbiont of Hartmannula sinica]|nr:flagellar basal body P-ring protein FlgI [Candidatus Megaera endosymbiont of Hartmannula sinica]